MVRVHPSLACWPGQHHTVAAFHACDGVRQSPWGELNTAHAQLVPQSKGVLDEAVVESLLQAHPSTRFRLHANVGVLSEHRLADLSNLDEHQDWWAQASRINVLLGGQAYSAHAGRRANASLQRVFDNARRAADLMGVPVAVEGLYPTANNMWLLSSWDEYAQLLASDLPYALDLSHLNILAHHTNRQELGLVLELASSACCIELHVSGNDGRFDQHRQIKGSLQDQWWAPALQALHPACVVFTEAAQEIPGYAPRPHQDTPYLSRNACS